MTKTRHPQAEQDAIAQRRKQVAYYRMMHFPQREIAKRVGVSVATVNRDLQAVREEWMERRNAAYGSWVAEEIAKLDALEKVWLPRALSRESLDTGTVREVMRIMDRRAKLLGLDRPEEHRHEVVSVDAVEAEIRRLRDEHNLAAEASGSVAG